MNPLPRSFYDRGNVATVARGLLGKRITTHISGVMTAGIITETEAYAGAIDRASHAFGGKRTPRNGVMYGPPGYAYIYLCYGIHHLFNVVSGPIGLPHAVLVRAIHPVAGLVAMRKRRGQSRLTTGGPGTLTQALGIRTEQNGADLLGKLITVEETGIRIPARSIITGPRIGVDYAKEDALLPYRFHFDPRILE